jgi:cyclomaltodextrinase
MNNFVRSIFILFLLFVSIFSQSCTNKQVQTSKNTDIGNVPTWAKGAIWYQIFPERFNNGDPTNDPTAERIGAPDNWEITRWGSDWYARADWEKQVGTSFRRTVYTRRYGGDLQGVIDKLDYLKELGINAIYFNPVFDAKTLHKYDASYYHHIDRFFGPDPEGDQKIFIKENPADPGTWQLTSADSLFLKLIQEAHKKNIRVIIDGVFNHTGQEFWAFADIVKNQQNSEYKDWYDILSWDDPETPDTNEFDFKGWAGYKGLPEFKEIEGNFLQPVREHIFAITKRWMDPNNDGDPTDGIDGWRLDVTLDIGHPFWKEWNNYVRSINKDAYTTAEIWEREQATEYVSEDQFTAVMNYPFLRAMHKFFIKQDITAYHLDTMLANIRAPYKKNVNLSMMNLMGSHDTERFASMIVNKDNDFKDGTKILNNKDTHYDIGKPNERERLVQKLIILFQFTYLGSPMIYYGDEAGMWGADDPCDRKPMVWAELKYDNEVSHPFGKFRPIDTVQFNQDLFNWYKKLSGIRNSNEVMKTGNYKTLYTNDDQKVFVFARYNDKNDLAIVGVNRGDTPITVKVKIDLVKQLSSAFKDELTNAEYTVSNNSVEIILAPVNGVLLIN